MTLFSTSIVLKPFRLAISLVLTGLLCACASTGKQELPAVTEDGLTLVPDTAAYAVYRSPNADLGHYDRVYISDIEVAFRDDWVKDQNQERRRASHRVTQEDADRIKAAVSESFGEILTEELEEGGYQVVEQVAQAESTDDLLLLRPAIVNLDVSAPDTQSPGRTRTYTASAASMSLYMEFRDSVTGALLGRVADSKAARDHGYMSVSNSVTNRAEAERMLRKWAKLLVAALDKAHEK